MAFRSEAMPNIFVITVCRNAVALIGETILSVLSQSYPNVKYIIIDGASTDGTIDIIRKYEDKLAYWISEPDKGIYDAMNKGLAIARSIDPEGWVNFMNAGDTFTSDTVIESVFSKVISNKIQVIGGHANMVYSKDVEILYAQGPASIKHQLPYCHQSTFVRLTVGSEPWTFDTRYRIAADYKLFYDIYIQKGESAFLTINHIVANYRMEDSMTFNNLKKVKREYLSIQSSHKDWTWWKEYIKWLCC